MKFLKFLGSKWWNILVAIAFIVIAASEGTLYWVGGIFAVLQIGVVLMQWLQFNIE